MVAKETMKYSHTFWFVWFIVCVCGGRGGPKLTLTVVTKVPKHQYRNLN